MSIDISSRLQSATHHIAQRSGSNESQTCTLNRFSIHFLRGLSGWGSRASHEIICVWDNPVCSSVCGGTNRPDTKVFEATDRPNIKDLAQGLM